MLLASQGDCLKFSLRTTSNRVANSLGNVEVVIDSKTLQKHQVGQIHGWNQRQDDIGTITIIFPIVQIGDQVI